MSQMLAVLSALVNLPTPVCVLAVGEFEDEKLVMLELGEGATLALGGFRA